MAGTLKDAGAVSRAWAWLGAVAAARWAAFKERFCWPAWFVSDCSRHDWDCQCHACTHESFDFWCRDCRAETSLDCDCRPGCG